MTPFELQTTADRADQLRAMAEQHRRSAIALADAGQRAQAASRRLEAMLSDLQATALEASPGCGPRPVAVRARAMGRLGRYQGAGL
jgi:hypothetical protein